MENQFRIRNAGVGDVGLIRALAAEIWPQTYKTILSAIQIQYMMDMMYSEHSLRRQVEQGHRFLIMEKGDEPAGFGSFSKTGEHGVYKLHKIYVHPALQGQGLGRMMIDYVSNAVSASGGRFLDLNVNRNNKAKDFYEKLGFEVIAEEDIDIGNGFFMNDYVMRKRL